MKKILILTIYPAPYRAELYKYFFKNYDVDLFFEKNFGDGRDKSWFTIGDYEFIDTKKGKAAYNRAIRNLKNYELIVIYEYSSKIATKLISRCKKQKVPYVINCDGVILPHKKNILKDLIKKFLLSKATAYMASGQHAKEYFLRYGADENKIYFHNFSTLHKEDILSNPIDDEDKKVIRQKLGLPLDKKLAIAVGRFIPLKRYDFLLRAWKAIDDDCCLLLIGGGEEYSKYQQIIKEHGLKNVIIENFHPPKELYEYFKASDVFIHPTSYDVWGLVVNEAMSVGLPVVVSANCIAGLELVKDGKNGYLFTMGKEEEGISKLKEILWDNDLRRAMSKESISTIRNYTVEEMAKAQMQVFEKILE